MPAPPFRVECANCGLYSSYKCHVRVRGGTPPTSSGPSSRHLFLGLREPATLINNLSVALCHMTGAERVHHRRQRDVPPQHEENQGDHGGHDSDRLRVAPRALQTEVVLRRGKQERRFYPT